MELLWLFGTGGASPACLIGYRAFAAELCRYVQRTESPLNGLDH